MAARRLRLIDTEETMSQPAEKPLRVAIATQDMARLNAHFGSAKTFAIYDVTSTTSAFVEAVGFDDVADESGSHSPLDDRITPKVDALNGCNLLFVLANLARHLDIDPEAALRRTNAKFRRRFAYIEKNIEQRSGKPLPQANLDEMEALWQEAKTEAP